MRDVKIVARGEVDENDERLIENYLLEKDMQVQIFSTNTERNRIGVLELELEEQANTILVQQQVIEDNAARIMTLESEGD